MKASREQIQQLLTETILALCNNGLDYEMEMEVDGLLGITLDKKDVVLVKISEVIQGGKSSTLNKLKIFEEPNSTLSSPRSMPEIDQPLFFGKRNICSPMKNSKSAKRQRHESAPSGTLNGSRSRARSPYNLQDFPQDLSQASERFRHSSATLSKSEPLDLRPEGSKNGNSVSQPLLPDGIERGQGEIANESQKQTKEPIPQKQADLSGDALSIDSRSLQQDSPLAQQIILTRFESPPFIFKPSKYRPRSRTPEITSRGIVNVLPYTQKQELGSFRRESKKVLTRAEEKFLVDWVFEKANTKEGITVRRVLAEVKSWLDSENKDTVYNDNMPTEEWFREFLRRHPELYAIKWWN